MAKDSFSGSEATKCGQEIHYITERAVFKLAENELELLEVAPGIDIQKDILDKMAFRPRIPKEFGTMDPRIFCNSNMNLKQELLTM